jgi:hypothetical protein
MRCQAASVSSWTGATRATKIDAMQFVKQPVERKLSESLGVPVTIEKLNLSPLSGSLEVTNVVVGTLATVRRVKASVSVGALLRKELVVKSVVIEGPTITITRQADGSINFPKRPAKPPTTKTTDESAEGGAPSKWSLAAEKVQLLDGAIHFRDGAYHLSVERAVAELAQKPDGVHITALAASLGRRDQPLELGEGRAHGVLGGVQSIAEIAGASLDASFEAGDAVRGSVQSPSLKDQKFDVDIAAKLMLGMLLKLVPERFLPPLSIDGNADGRVILSWNPRGGLRIKTLSIQASEVRLRSDRADGTTAG